MSVVGRNMGRWESKSAFVGHNYVNSNVKNL